MVQRFEKPFSSHLKLLFVCLASLSTRSPILPPPVCLFVYRSGYTHPPVLISSFICAFGCTYRLVYIYVARVHAAPLVPICRCDCPRLCLGLTAGLGIGSGWTTTYPMFPCLNREVKHGLFACFPYPASWYLTMNLVIFDMSVSASFQSVQLSHQSSLIMASHLFHREYLTTCSFLFQSLHKSALSQ
jgi:hypothetical protein